LVEWAERNADFDRVGALYDGSEYDAANDAEARSVGDWLRLAVDSGVPQERLATIAQQVHRGSWTWDKIARAVTGGRDELMRDYDTPTAVASALGIKLTPIDVDLEREYRAREFAKQMSSLKFERGVLRRDLERNLISEPHFQNADARLEAKMEWLEARKREVLGSAPAAADE
jgi:hypothetical protein